MFNFTNYFYIDYSSSRSFCRIVKSLPIRFLRACFSQAYFFIIELNRRQYRYTQAIIQAYFYPRIKVGKLLGIIKDGVYFLSSYILASFYSEISQWLLDILINQLLISTELSGCLCSAIPQNNIFNKYQNCDSNSVKIYLHNYINQQMSSLSELSKISTKRYHDYNLKALISQLNQQSQIARKKQINQIKEDRKLHMSCTEMSNRTNVQPDFNNKTKFEGSFFQKQTKQVPYLFIPKYKNETFIMPDRVFAKGKQGKRFHVQMKDTSVFSFRDNQTLNMGTVLKKKEKEKTIDGRKMQQLNRILDSNDGRCKSLQLKYHLKNRKKFNPTSTTSQLFSIAQPMLQPKQSQRVITKKTSLSRTFVSNKWRPNSRTSMPFSVTTSSFLQDRFTQFKRSVR